ncbi:transcriptional activator demeter [Phtheirospermum japonicum]|uniref:Transcriptional activator demeter n=1 Tax=Phtheirospermum japonicum TaxID=374723 RepID=A0A830BXT0_9LAMI|nr:transcriptional activator demeter [Phtheirospermum japonicum]
MTDFEDHINGVEMVLLEHKANIDILNYRDSDVGSPSSVSFVVSSDDEEEDDEEDDVSASQDYDLYKKALVDFSSQVMEGDRQLSPWKGSVVDTVVYVLLTQNVHDSLSSHAFMNLASKFPTVSDGESDFAIHDSELLRIVVGLYDEVDLEQSMVANDSTSCPTSQNQDDPEDGNVYSSQTESTSGERKGKDGEKQVTNYWDELRVKYCTKNRQTVTIILLIGKRLDKHRITIWLHRS